MKKVVLGLALVALAVAATASARTASSAAIPGCAPSSLNLLKPGTLTVGTDNPAFPPWFGGAEKNPFKISNPYSGKGYESAVTYALAKRLGFARSAVKWTPVPFLRSFAPGKEAVRLLPRPGLGQADPGQGGHLQLVVLRGRTRRSSGSRGSRSRR